MDCILPYGERTLGRIQRGSPKYLVSGDMFDEKLEAARIEGPTGRHFDESKFERLR